MSKLNNTSDIMVLLADSQGQAGIILHEDEVSTKLFDLSSGLAGELFQKMVNYNKRLALVVRDLSQYSTNLQKLAYEHENHPYIRFYSNRADAEEWVKD